MRADLLIVGGGPVGLATAIYAARAGLSALVVDRGPIPDDKACGEGIMPLGVDCLRALRVKIPEGSSVPFTGIRFVDGSTVAEATFATGCGLGMRRAGLATVLASRAEHLGVTLRSRCEARGWVDQGGDVALDTSHGRFHGRWLVGADGLHSRVRRMAQLELPTRGRPRFGMRRHFAIAPWSSFVEVHWANDAEAYVTPTGADEVGVAILWNGGGSFEEELQRFPALHARLAGAARLDPVRGAGPLHQRVRRRHRGNVVLVGDAAGYVDAITGEGLTIGFRCAAALVDTLANDRPLTAYEHAYRRITRDYVLVTRLLLVVAARPWLRRRVVAALARAPRTFGRLVGVASGEVPLRGIGAAHVARLVCALARTPAVPAPYGAEPTLRA